MTTCHLSYLPHATMQCNTGGSAPHLQLVLGPAAVLGLPGPPLAADTPCVAVLGVRPLRGHVHQPVIRVGLAARRVRHQLRDRLLALLQGAAASGLGAKVSVRVRIGRVTACSPSCAERIAVGHTAIGQGWESGSGSESKGGNNIVLSGRDKITPSRPRPHRALPSGAAS